MTAATIPLEQHLAEINALNNQVQYLTEQLEWFKRQIFGQKAEKFVDTQQGQQLYLEGFEPFTPSEESKKKHFCS